MTTAMQGDLVQLTSNLGVTHIGIMWETKFSYALGTKAAPTMTIWRILVSDGVYSYIREEGWKLHLIDS